MTIQELYEVGCKMEEEAYTSRFQGVEEPINSEIIEESDE